MSYLNVSPFSLLDQMDYFGQPRYVRPPYVSPRYYRDSFGFRNRRYVAPTRYMNEFGFNDLVSEVLDDSEFNFFNPFSRTRLVGPKPSKNDVKKIEKPLEAEGSSVSESSAVEAPKKMDLTLAPVFGEVSRVINEDVYNYNIALPGLSVDDVTLDLDKATQTLIVKAQRQVEEKKTNEFGSFTSVSRLSFSRRLPIPENTTKEQIKADLEDGTLKIAIDNPKKEKAAAGGEIKVHESTSKPTSPTADSTSEAPKDAQKTLPMAVDHGQSAGSSEAHMEMEPTAGTASTTSSVDSSPEASVEDDAE